MRSIIFDLDLTLVDTTCLEEARHERNWQKAYGLIPQTSLYKGIQEGINGGSRQGSYACGSKR